MDFLNLAPKFPFSHVACQDISIDHVMCHRPSKRLKLSGTCHKMMAGAQSTTIELKEMQMGQGNSGQRSIREIPTQGTTLTSLGLLVRFSLRVFLLDSNSSSGS